MKSKILASLTIAIAIIGCSNPPKPVELDSNSAITINQELLRKESHQIPLDPFLKDTNWTYNLFFTKINGEYVPNDLIVKTFYVAHNANTIIIIGDDKIANEYKNYFVTNGCKAENIVIHRVDSINFRKDRVNVLFFGKKQGTKDEKSIIEKFHNSTSNIK